MNSHWAVPPFEVRGDEIAASKNYYNRWVVSVNPKVRCPGCHVAAAAGGSLPDRD
jgi:hypothetical protein